MLHAANRYAYSPDIPDSWEQRPGQYSNGLMQMTSQMIQQKPSVRVWLLTAEIGILWHHIYEADLCQRSWQQGIHLVLITVQKLVHKNSATGPVSETEMCCDG